MTALRFALSHALMGLDDRSLAIALAVADSPAYAPSDGSSPGPDDHSIPRRPGCARWSTWPRTATPRRTASSTTTTCPGVFRFIYYRVSSQQLAEDLTSETFVRALRAIQRFNWQGKDFGAWLTTIARNLVADHFKSSRARLELVTETIPEGRATVASPEEEVLALISNEMLFEAVNSLPNEQRDCVLMRFIQGLSIAQTAAALGRSEGAIKQLQLRAVRSLAKTVSVDVR